MPSTWSSKRSSPEADRDEEVGAVFRWSVDAGVADGLVVFGAGSPVHVSVAVDAVGRGDGGGAGEVVAGEDLALELGELCVGEDVFDGGKAAGVEDVDLAGEGVAEAVEEAGGLEGIDVRAAAAAGYSGAGVGADDGDGVDVRGVEREEIVFVLEQGEAFACAFERDLGAVLVVEGDVGVELTDD